MAPHDLKCSACGQTRILTEGKEGAPGVLVCANKDCEGGRVKPVTKKDHRDTLAQLQFVEWLAGFPEATALKRGFSIEGRPLAYKKYKPDGEKTSRIKKLALAMDVAGIVPAKVGEKVYYFIALKKQPKHMTPKEPKPAKEPAGA